ncbi:hypothetical protein [Myroides sp. WP-1]|uniref:hypothetical protein n=1 Tax=Myroides sp. WP-1 TaxID=2759944 RepID=UPI0015FCAD37|nr:hypothetical protein [Myroides sp. WP-1]MBB1139812.1 hypothetical protein [Myroides sp. WP-1]
MRTLLLICILLYTSFGSYAQFGLNVFDGLTAKAVINFKDGTREIGTVKENGPLIGFRRNDPDELKFKNNGAEDYRLVSSETFNSIIVYHGKKEEYATEYFPIRLREYKQRGVFSDKYYVDYFQLVHYNDISFARLHLFVNGKYANEVFLFPVKGTDYYFKLDGGYKKNGKMAEIMKHLDPNCQAFTSFIQTNYIDSSNYKSAYKQALKQLKENKTNFMQQQVAKGLKNKEARVEYKIEEDFIFIKQILDKYSELCTHEN